MPVTYLALSYNGYAYGETVEEITEDLGYRHRMSKAANRDGAFAAPGLHDPRRLSASGVLVGAGRGQDVASLRAAWDAFKGAHQPGAAAPLHLDSDRYLNAQVEHLSFKFDGLSYQVQLSFLAYDPYWYAAQPTTAALTQNAATTVTPAGTATSLPLFTFTVGSAPPGSLLTLTNAQDVSLSFAPPAGGTYIVDCAAEAITDRNGTDQTASMTGDFISLVAGPNALTLSLSGGLALTAQSVTWTDRWV